MVMMFSSVCIEEAADWGAKACVTLLTLANLFLILILIY